MKVFPSRKVLKPLLVVFALLATSALVYAAAYTSYPSFKSTTGTTITVAEHGVGKNVTNTSGKNYFIPTKTAAEWSSFVSAASSLGISLSGLSWYDSGFGSCSNTCSGYTQTRTVWCAGTDGATTADSYCTTTKPSTTNTCAAVPSVCPVAGVCGVSGACSTGTASGYSAGSCGGSQTWSCTGPNGGSTVSCSTANGACAVAGVCGVSGACSTGTASGYSAGSCGGSQTWSCTGSNGGATVSCSTANAACTWQNTTGNGYGGESCTNWLNRTNQNGTAVHVFETWLDYDCAPGDPCPVPVANTWNNACLYRDGRWMRTVSPDTVYPSGYPVSTDGGNIYTQTLR